MITCKKCKKYAKLTKARINGLDEVTVWGSCKHCGYENKKEAVDYTDFEELGFKNR